MRPTPPGHAPGRAPFNFANTLRCPDREICDDRRPGSLQVRLRIEVADESAVLYEIPDRIRDRHDSVGVHVSVSGHRARDVGDHMERVEEGREASGRTRRMKRPRPMEAKAPRCWRVQGLRDTQPPCGVLVLLFLRRLVLLRRLDSTGRPPVMSSGLRLSAATPLMAWSSTPRPPWYGTAWSAGTFRLPGPGTRRSQLCEIFQGVPSG